MHQNYVNIDPQDEEAYKLGVKSFDFDAFLGPYPNDKYIMWKHHSKFITQKVIHMLNASDVQLDQEYDEV